MGQTTREAPAAAAPAYRVPYRLSETKHILVRARVNGRGPYNFVMDTGAPDLFMAAEKAKEAGCRVGADHYASIKSFEIEGGPTLRSVRSRVEEIFQLRSMNAIDAAGARIDGVLGYSVLARFRMEIDLSRSEMVWTRLAYDPPKPPTLLQLTGGKVPPAAKDAKNMENLAQWASALYQRKPSPPPVARGFLGLEFTSANSLTIARLFPNGPGDRAGLLPGDRVIAVEIPPREAVDVESFASLRALLSQLRAGSTLKIIVERDSRKRSAEVVAGKGPL